MATVTVQYFAVLRETKGVESERVELRPGENVGALYARLFPAGPAGRLPVAYARNLEYVSSEATLADGDEVAFLPPLGGG